MDALADRGRGLRRAAKTFHPQRPGVRFGTVGFAGGFLGFRASVPRVDFGAHDLAASDDLARLGAHGLALHRRLRAGATPLGLGAGNAPATPELCDV